MSLVLALNSGSSNLKYALFRASDRAPDGAPESPAPIAAPGSPGLARIAAGKIEIGSAGPGAGNGPAGATAEAALDRVAEALAPHARFESLDAVGHRVVHGGPDYTRPLRVTPPVIDALRALAPYDPQHLPSEIALMQACGARVPGAAQVACFDTGFHAALPRIARLLPIPRRYEGLGVRRYGFHGLSYACLMEALGSVGWPNETDSRIVLAHLGNGASLTAVKAGRPIDTTMAFTPASGVPMSRRSGDLDPGLLVWLMRHEGMSGEAINTLVHEESGLLGVSETSADVRVLLAREATDERAREALDLFCYEVRKKIGAFAAALGGIDTLVFSGGIGENAPGIRARIVAGLEFLGVRLDPARNDAATGGPAPAAGDGVADAAEKAGGMGCSAADATLISPEGAPVTVRVIRTDEEMQIARAVMQVLAVEAAAAPGLA